MAGIRQSSMALATLFAVASTMCTSDEPVLVGAHVEYFSPDGEIEICAGTADNLDAFVQRVFTFLDVILPPEFHVRVRFGESPCSTNCYDPEDGAVYVGGLDVSPGLPVSSLRHEIVHAIVIPLWGRSVPFFEEGLAEALSRGESWRARAAEGPVGDQLDRAALELKYSIAAGFTRFLIDTRGLGRFKALFSRVQTRTQEAIRADFLEVYGETLDVIEAEYLSAGRACGYQFDVCEPSEAIPVGDKWSVEIPLSCLDPSVYGGGSVGRNGLAMATLHNLEIERSGRYRLRVTGSAASRPGRQFRVFFERCGDCIEQIEREYFAGEFEIVLSTGFYAVSFDASDDQVASFELEYLGDS